MKCMISVSIISSPELKVLVRQWSIVRRKLPSTFSKKYNSKSQWVNSNKISCKVSLGGSGGGGGGGGQRLHSYF